MNEINKNNLSGHSIITVPGMLCFATSILISIKLIACLWIVNFASAAGVFD